MNLESSCGQHREPNIVLLYSKSGYATCAVGPDSKDYIVDISIDSSQETDISNAEVQYRSLSGIQNRIIQCDLNEKKCRDKWTQLGFIVFSSSNYNTNSIDERWEMLPILTNGSKKHIDSENFAITISLWFKETCEIKLCAKETKAESAKCYHLNIRKQSNNLQYKLKDCVIKNCTRIQDVNNTGFAPKWLHLKISKYDKKITFLQYKKNGFTNIYQHTDKESFKINHIVVNSPYGNGNKWKLHHYTSVDWNKPNISYRMEPVFIAKHYLCISFYTWMCPHCSLNISVIRKDNSIMDTIREEYKGEWQNVRIHKNVTGTFYLKIKGEIRKNNYKSYWIINNIRQCYYDEVRYVSVNVKNNSYVSCGTLHDPQWNVTSGISSCPKAEYCRNKLVGTKCNIPCLESSGDYCTSNTTVCENVDKNPQCYCFQELFNITNKISVPKAPENLTAKWINNKLTLSWKYPDITKIPIYHFIIELNYTYSESTKIEAKDFNFKLVASEITPNYYYSVYEILPDSTTYEISVYGVNKYRGIEAKLKIDLPPEIPVLKENAYLVSVSNLTATILIPDIDQSTLSPNSCVCILVAKKANSIILAHNDALDYFDQTNSCFMKNATAYQWVAAIFKPNAEYINFTVGDNTTTDSFINNETFVNKLLTPSTTYMISIVPINMYGTQRTFTVYNFEIITMEGLNENYMKFAYSLLLLIPLAALLIYW